MKNGTSKEEGNGRGEENAPDGIHFGSEGLEREQEAEHELLVLLLAERRVRPQPHMVMQANPIPIEDVHASHA